MEIKKVVVIGSGTMGSGIAAHLCNANVPVTLLDLTTEISEKARERIKQSRPPLLIDKAKINNIDVGNIEDDFNVVKEADWIVEAVVERIDIKPKLIAEDIVEEKPPENGCSFQGRCPRILGDKCRSEVPPWQVGENGNAIRCHIGIEKLKNLQT